MTLEEMKKLIAEESARLAAAAAEANAKAVTEAVNAAVIAATKPLNEKIAALEKAAANPKPEKKGKAKKDEGGEGDDDNADAEQMPAWAKTFTDGVLAKLDPILKERDSATKADAAKKLLATIAEKTKQPRVANDPVLLDKIIAGNITDEAAATAAVTAHTDYLKAQGVDLTKWAGTASPAAEGAKGTAGDATDREAQIAANVDAASKARKVTF